MKISAWTIIIAGIAFGWTILAFGYFRHWKPNTEEMAKWKVVRDDLRAVAEQMPQAQKRVDDAQKLRDSKVVEWQQIVATRTLPPTIAQGGIDLGISRWQLVIELPKFRNSLQRMVNQQLRAGGVTVVSGPTIPSPANDPNGVLASYFNYPALPFPVVIFDLGTVTVEGTYKEISDNINAWTRMPRFLAVADGLRLNGTAPNLTGTYQVTIVGFLQTPRPIFPQVPEGGVRIAAATPVAPANPAVPGGNR